MNCHEETSSHSTDHVITPPVLRNRGFELYREVRALPYGHPPGSPGHPLGAAPGPDGNPKAIFLGQV